MRSEFLKIALGGPENKAAAGANLRPPPFCVIKAKTVAKAYFICYNTYRYGGIAQLVRALA